MLFTMRPGYRLLRFLAQWIFILYGRGRVFGLQNVPRTGAVILASNHQSFFDPIIVGLPVLRECHFMARDTLFHNRYFGALIRWLNAFPVKRGTADIGAIKESLRRLKKDAPLVTFPEGTRTLDGRVLPLHPGIVGIARRARCPIVPVVVEGAYEIWPRHQTWPGRAPLWVAFGRPVTQAELAGMGPDQAAQFLTERMRDLHNELRQRVGRQPHDYGKTGGPA